MRVTFVLPAYYAEPIGGYRIVYLYANFLAAKGHAVTIVFPRQLSDPEDAQDFVDRLKSRLWSSKIRLQHRPLVNWQWIDPRVRLLLVPQLVEHWLPRGDAIVATAWQTARPVMELSASRGAKYYLIQHHETWAGPELEVNATWRFPMRLIVISKWLYELGEALGARQLRYIPNAIDQAQFRVLNAPATRAPHIVSLYHTAAWKGVGDALNVLSRFHLCYPDIPVTMFGTTPRGADIPAWIDYHQNPTQDALVKNIYNGATVYLGASLTEGWALPPAEAMACGCAFVGSACGGFREYAEHEVTALLSLPGDRKALLTNLCRMIDDKALAARIQENGTALIRRFTWERSGKMMEAYLAESTLNSDQDEIHLH